MRAAMQIADGMNRLPNIVVQRYNNRLVNPICNLFYR